jgi:hypothetical protein
MKKIVVILVLAVSVMVTCAPAFGEDPAAGVMVVDVLLVRPISLVGSILGTAFFIVALPVALTSGSVDSVARKLVVEPWKFTFARPVGEFYDPWLGSYEP